MIAGARAATTCPKLPRRMTQRMLPGGGTRLPQTDTGAEIARIVSTTSSSSSSASSSRSVRAFSPGGIGNIGPGLDILGCAVTGAGDTVRAALSHERGVCVVESGHPQLSRDPSTHASAIAAAEVLRRADARDIGVTLHVE